MITNLRIQNFKGWEDTGELRLAPITVLFGGNSSGKSSIGQFLMMLKQTTESSDRTAGLQLGGDRRSIVDMGTWDDMVHAHRSAAELSFDLGWTLPEPLALCDPIEDREVRGDHLSLAARIGQTPSGEGAGFVRCRGFRYTLSEGGSDTLRAEYRPSAAGDGAFEVAATGLDLVRAERRPSRFPPPHRFYGFPQEVSAYHRNAQDLDQLPLSVETLFQRTSYLGPVRASPRRQYIWSGETPPDVGSEGENWLSAYLSSADRRIGPEATPFQEVAGRWLEEIGLVHGFQAQPVAKGAREYRARVKTGPRSEWVSIPDAGFGVSQFMPVLVQCLYAPAHSIVVVEQPELHLHPAVQQNLADLFVEVVQSRENGRERQIQLIVESHSEHFLGRLQRRIAEERIAADDVAAYFLSQSPSGAQVATPLEVDPFGNIRNWPRNFFGDAFGDAAERQRAGLLRRRQSKPGDAAP